MKKLINFPIPKLRFIILLFLLASCSSLKESSVNDDLYYTPSNEQSINNETFNNSKESEISNDNVLFDFKFIKAHNKTKGTTTNRPYNITAGKGLKKVQIRFKVKSKSGLGEVFDPNGFYVVDDKDKLRYRPVDVQHHAMLLSFVGFNRLVNDSIFSNMKKNQYFSYRPDIKDIFEDYKIEGYKDIEQRINFGTNRKPVAIVVYFKPKKIKSKLVDLFFIVPKEFVNGKIYYKGEKLNEFEIVRYSL